MAESILILGGTGFVGRALCEHLQRRRAGSRLIVPTRRLAHGQAIRHLPSVELVQADVHDPATLEGLLRGCSAVINLIAILHGSPSDFERVHVELPRKLVQACKAAGVHRVLHVSALGVGSQAPSNYLRSKAAGEAVLLDSKLDVTLLRPSVIFGAQDRFMNTFASLQALAPVVPLACAYARFQPVWVEDVAQALVHALDQREAAGQIIECAGPEVWTLGDLVRAAGRWSGHQRPVLPLPAWLGTLQAMMMEWAPGEPLMTRDNLASMAVPNVAGGRLPGLQSLGITPSSLSAIGPVYLGGREGCARLDDLRRRAGRG